MDDSLSPAVFFATIKIRELMFRVHRQVRSRALARYLRKNWKDVHEALGELQSAGLVGEGGNGWFLLEEGERSIQWSAPPPPDGMVRAAWVGELANALAEHYEVSVHDMLLSTAGTPVVARSRLCFALYARGWPLERIEEHFGLPAGWARRAVERWKRLRDQSIPKSGPELREWRERLGLTQAQAAIKLGVHPRTVRRSEMKGTFSRRSSLARA